jgi:hypothetical protein
MRNRIHRAASIALPAALCAMLGGCQGGGGTIEVGVTSSGQALTVVTNPADGGTTPVTGAQLLLDVERVDVHVAGSGDMDDDPPAGLTGGGPNHGDDGGWITVFAGAAQVDLLQPGAVETFLGSAPTPAGKVTQIRLVLAHATWVDGATATPVACPSCGTSGLKIVTMGKLVVPNGGILHVTLDFDREHSLHVGTDGTRLDPVIKIARADTR